MELKIWIFHQIGGWSSDHYEGGLNLFYAPETDFGRRWSQTQIRPFLTYFDVFSSFTGFILSETDQKCTYNDILVSKFSKCLINGNSDRFWAK